MIAGETSQSYNEVNHNIYLRTVSSQLLWSGFLNWFKLVYGTFKQSNMHLTLDFCSDHLGKKLNVPKLKTKLRVYGLYTLL